MTKEVMLAAQLNKVLKDITHMGSWGQHLQWSQQPLRWVGA
jgi:hypothetical protein